MEHSKRLIIIAFISALGLWLIVAGARAGTNPAGLPAPIPTPQDLPVDAGILPGATSPERASVTLQRVWTVTLEPRWSDMLSSTWSVLVENVFYNWPANDPSHELTYTLSVPGNAWDVSANTPSGPLEFVNGQASPGLQDWITVTYRTMSQTWPYRAERLGNLIAMNLQVGGSTGELYYSPLTTTVVYTRQFPAGAPSDQWGYVPFYTPLELQSIEPAPTERSDEEGWARWVTTTNYFTSAVTVREPLLGSDLTITQLLMDPPDFELGHSNRFTATIKNIGTMTASRWFYNELYVRPENDPPPSGASDHEWGLITYQGDALLREPGTEGNYKVEYLAPGKEIELFTVITVTNLMAGGISYTVYAQADTAYSDPLRWAWFGTNPEGYGTAPYTQEQNVVRYGPFVFNPKVYGVQVQSASGKAPKGKTVVYRVPITNIGNVSDTYSITLTGWTWLSTAPPSIGPVPNLQTAYLPITVTVPSTAREDIDFDVCTITVTSKHDPAKTAQGTITTIATYYHLYLPIVLKK
jgi:hypothetical protein